MSAIIGIDLGTSTTEAAVYRNGKPEIILNLDHAAVTPSVVGIDQGGNWLVGERARAQALLFPENTAMEVKRKTGSGERIALGKATFEPVELQARLLSYVRTYASEFLGEEVDRAVISVPAYFNDRQRRETIRAGKMAGFFVERILNEPTAAAMRYGLSHLDENSHVLVYDLGGGTFDVTLLEMFEGVLEVKASSGDNQLGGKDFDEALMEWLFAHFQSKHGKNLRQDRYALARVKEEAEKCKIALSTQDTYRVIIPAVCTINGQPVALDETVTRAQFENLTADLLERTHDPIDRVLGDTRLRDDEIDRVILVGGSTRMPMIVEDIARFLGRAPEQPVDPDFAVAEGAAVMAGIIAGEVDEREGLVMTDVNPFSLGVRVRDERTDTVMSVVIPRNTTIPTERTERYATASPRQTVAKIEVYQGESRDVTHNHFLGEFEVKGIPPKPAGMEKINVTFSYDLNGLLVVRAAIVSTGEEAMIEIHMGRDEEKPDVSAWKTAPDAPRFRAIIRRAERAVAQNTLPGGLKERVETLLFKLKQALIAGNVHDAERAEGELTAALRKTEAQ